MLTVRQREVMLFIQNYMDENGDIAPSVREISSGTGVHSSAGAHRIVLCLEERGYIKKLPNRARALKILQRVKK